ncbi:hypothetical protein U1Q18_040310 [Sarracenia purpurea var. burkii]
MGRALSPQTGEGADPPGNRFSVLSCLESEGDEDPLVEPKQNIGGAAQKQSASHLALASSSIFEEVRKVVEDKAVTGKEEFTDGKSESSEEVYDEATEGAFEKLALDALDKAKQGRSALNKSDIEAVVEWLAWYRSSPLSDEKTVAHVNCPVSPGEVRESRVAEDDLGILGVKVSDLNPKLTKQEQVGPSLGVLEEGDASLRKNVAGEADEGPVEASLLVGNCSISKTEFCGDKARPSPIYANEVKSLIFDFHSVLIIFWWVLRLF